MVKRRKVLIGAGSLIAGGAAATGTGAFATMDTGSRTVTVEIEDDSASYVSLTQSSEYAKETEDGKLELFFDDSQAVFDGGVNPDSTYNFKDIFRVGAGNGNDTYFYIDASGFPGLDSISFTANEDAVDSPDTNDGAALDDPSNPYKLANPDNVAVDITMEVGSTSNVSGDGTITIHAAEDPNRP